MLVLKLKRCVSLVSQDTCAQTLVLPVWSRLRDAKKDITAGTKPQPPQCLVIKFGPVTLVAKTLQVSLNFSCAFLVSIAQKEQLLQKYNNSIVWEIIFAHSVLQGFWLCLVTLIGALIRLINGNLFPQSRIISPKHELLCKILKLRMLLSH